MTRTETFSGLKEFLITCHYFELLETLNPVDVTLFGENDRVIQADKQVEAGYFEDRRGVDPIRRIEITTSGSEAIKFLCSDGLAGTRRAFVRQAQARAIALPGSATVGTSEGQVLASALRAKVVFLSDPGNSDNIALGPSGVTISNSPILLSPGDMWIEEVSASAAWYAIAGTGSQTLRILTSS